MKAKNPHKKSLYTQQWEFYNGLNANSQEFKEHMKDGSFQRDPEGTHYHGSKEAAKAKNIYK